jgi:hypothetical protein
VHEDALVEAVYEWFVTVTVAVVDIDEVCPFD